MGKPSLSSLETLPLIQDTDASNSKLSQWLQRVVHWRIPARLHGIVLVATSAFLFSLLSTLIKFASYSMPSMETVFWRSIVAWLLNLIAVRVCGVSLKVSREFWPALLARCLIGSCGMCLAFYAMQQLVLADASVLVFTSPVMTFFVGALVLHEHIDPINLGFAVFSFVGVVCVSRPTIIFGDRDEAAGPSSPHIAIFAALLSAMCQACAYVSMRSLKQLHFVVVIHYFLLTASILSGFSLVFVQHAFVMQMSTPVLLAVLGTGVLGFLGQLCLTRGFQLENAGTASIMRYLDVVFVFIWDWTLLHEHISMWSVVGAIIICACASAIAIRRIHYHR